MARSRKSKSRKRSTSRRSRRLLTRKQQRRLGLLVAVIAAIAVGGYLGTSDLFDDYLPDPVEASPDDENGADRDDDDSDDGSSGDSSGGSNGDVDVDEARELLSELTVDEWDTTRGYSRDRFSHWRSIDGCDARQTVLARDGDDIETRSDDDCRVVSGVWHSPFDDETFDDPSDIDIDHMVPLANAWRTGAADWDDDQRADFANDLDTPQLIAVSASSNRAKGDQDPSQWQPVRGFHCQYAYDWIVVKHHWELWVTEDEHDALSDMLDSCD